MDKLKKFKWILIVAILFIVVDLFFTYGLTDGATRIAHDIRRGAREMKSSGLKTFTISHHPHKFPEGCSESYQIQFSANSSIVIWCKDSAGQTTSSYSTTFHLNFVDVPTRLMIENKSVTEPLEIELSAGADKPSVISIR